MNLFSLQQGIAKVHALQEVRAFQDANVVLITLLTARQQELP